jgi:7-cyano-7-deazaguanine synthase
MNSKSWILLGGGIDSLAALEVARRDTALVGAVFFRYSVSEVPTPTEEAAQAIAKYYSIPFIGIPFVSLVAPEYWDILQTEGHYLPDRNLMFISVASANAKLAGIEYLYTGFVKGSPNIYDITTTFVERLNQVLDLDREFQVRVVAPFSECTKQEVADYLVEVNAPIHLSYSCYKDTIPPCGECFPCKARKLVLPNA